MTDFASNPSLIVYAAVHGLLALGLVVAAAARYLRREPLIYFAGDAVWVLLAASCIGLPAVAWADRLVS